MGSILQPPSDWVTDIDQISSPSPFSPHFISHIYWTIDTYTEMRNSEEKLIVFSFHLKFDRKCSRFLDEYLKRKMYVQSWNRFECERTIVICLIPPLKFLFVFLSFFLPSKLIIHRFSPTILLFLLRDLLSSVRA